MAKAKVEKDIAVVAIAPGYYGGILRRPGEANADFVVAEANQLSASWMQRKDGKPIDGQVPPTVDRTEREEPEAEAEDAGDIVTDGAKAYKLAKKSFSNDAGVSVTLAQARESALIGWCRSEPGRDVKAWNELPDDDRKSLITKAANRLLSK